MSKQVRKFGLVGIDVLIIWFSIASSYLFRFNGDIPDSYVHQLLIYGMISSILGTTSMVFFKLYNRIWEYASIGEMVSISKALVVACTLSYIGTYLADGSPVPLSVFMRTSETVLLLMGGIRFVWRIVRDNYIFYNKREAPNRALIIGAGHGGMLLAKELKGDMNSKSAPVAFIDDDRSKHGLQAGGIPIVGGRESIVEAASKYKVDDILIAMPSISRKEISEIIEICKVTKAKLKIIPRLDDLVQGKVSIKSIRDVDVEDLLGRDPVHIDLGGNANYVENKTILVTGAGGSIGSELCRQIAIFKPRKLLLLGRGENSIYSIEMEMRTKFPELQLETIIADVKDKERIIEIFKKYKPQVVFHAAAHKHVPLMEKNPLEAIKNNIFGTINVADAAEKFNSERFVLISTDKAVNPTSIMGATKRIAEMYVQGKSRLGSTKFAAVRFGNVLGSRGSVIPQFKQQIAVGGPVTVTHPDMIRYFMTIPEAAQLVIQAGAYAKGGEIFILDMGDPVKIVDLARDLIRLSGFEPDVDIKIEYTGIRPGEKLFEELLTNEEGMTSTLNNRIFVAKPHNIDSSELDFEIKRFEKLLEQDQGTLREVIRVIVPSYQNIS